MAQATEPGFLAHRVGDSVVRPLLELGGDAPFIVFEDADLESTVDGSMMAKFRDNGQSCIAANRFLVQEGVFDEFVSRLAARVNAMTVGDPATADPPGLGPLIDDERMRAVSAVVAEARDGGALDVTMPDQVPAGGSYLAPAILADVPDDAALATTEVFGPVAGVFPFATEEDAVARANATELGLAGYVYTHDLSRTWRLAERIDVGILGVNEPLPGAVHAPMGGTKQSGLGREGAEAGLAEFQEVRQVCLGS